MCKSSFPDQTVTQTLAISSSSPTEYAKMITILKLTHLLYKDMYLVKSIFHYAMQVGPIIKDTVKIAEGTMLHRI